MLDNGRYFLLIPIIQMFTSLGNYYVVMNIVYREVDWTNVIYLRTLLLLIHITNMNVHYLRYL